MVVFCTPTWSGCVHSFSVVPALQLICCVYTSNFNKEQFLQDFHSKVDQMINYALSAATLTCTMVQWCQPTPVHFQMRPHLPDPSTLQLYKQLAATTLPTTEKQYGAKDQHTSTLNTFKYLSFCSIQIDVLDRTC